ncbi:Ig-like domain-containing protein [Candidatus Pantoea persica]|uniref:Ig-like domain-containing protein n=1 Tax=Candidatus Pantoea persica TaxID=2518128 RepID=UPI00215D718C|nr:Ig-like domain-containing protein [Candidatus Pantoea persica]MBA2816238.1 Ig-like repeat domain protein [Candidatus Pantoea persica]
MATQAAILPPPSRQRICSSYNAGSLQGAIAACTTTDDNTPVLSGTAEAGATVSVYDNGTLLGTATVNADGSWSFTTPVLSNGSHSLTATVTDAAGNVSGSTSSLQITDDSGSTLVPLSDGASTSDATLLLSGPDHRRRAGHAL